MRKKSKKSIKKVYNKSKRNKKSIKKVYNKSKRNKKSIKKVYNKSKRIKMDGTDNEGYNYILAGKPGEKIAEFILAPSSSGYVECSWNNKISYS
jgi:hypothetical protein